MFLPHEHLISSTWISQLIWVNHISILITLSVVIWTLRSWHTYPPTLSPNSDLLWKSIKYCFAAIIKKSFTSTLLVNWYTGTFWNVAHSISWIRPVKEGGDYPIFANSQTVVVLEYLYKNTYFQDWLGYQAERWAKPIFRAKIGTESPILPKFNISQTAGHRKLVDPQNNHKT